MKLSRECSQTWKVEAIEDGRLGGAEREAFRRHVAACASCAAEVRALRELHAQMRIDLPVESSPLGRRRARASLLKRANDELIDPRLHRRIRPMVVLAASAILLLIAFGMRVGRSPRDANVIAAPSFEVSEVGQTVWSEERVGAVTHARLTSGAAWFRVQKTSAGQRFLLHLPDGEIEVHGTRFLVGVNARHTDRVEVSEGVVTLRLAGEMERRLGVGDSWSRAVTSVASAPPSTASAAEPSAQQPLSSPSVAPPTRSADAFTSGVEAFQTGDLRLADRLLAGFVARLPADPRAEDARFLRILAHTRWGDRKGARLLAEEYLHRYPNGLRRPEVDALISKP